jgi:S1-C subfamily serine protease
MAIAKTRTPRLGLAPAACAALLLAPLAAHALDDDGGAAAEPARAEAAQDQKLSGEERARAEQRLKEAQDRMESAARDMAELSMKLSDEHGAMERAFIMMGDRRAQLGMAIDMRADDKSGEGVHVLSVNPGGPAEAAGIRANDVVTSLGGKALKGDGKQPAARQLLDLLRNAKPGEALPIEFKHEGKLVKAKVVPTRPDPHLAMQGMPGMPGMGDMHGLPGMPGMAGHPMPGLEGHPGMRDVQVRMLLQDGGFGGTQFVELTPGLGSYFGTDKGLLVVRAPANSRFKLQDGDVLLDIDGRVPTSVGHAMQILASYKTGEKVKLHLMRQKQKVELAVDLPEGD